MLDSAEIFVHVVRPGSLSGASRVTGIPVSTISDRIANLEARLQTTLLKRTTRRLILTETGQAYFDIARRAVEELRRFETEVISAAPLATGTLRLASTLAMDGVLAPIITAYLLKYVGVSIELVMNARNEDLVGGRIDAAIRLGLLPDDSSLIVRTLGKTSLRLFASPDYLAKVPSIQSPEDLVPADILCFTDVERLELHHAGGASSTIGLIPRFSSSQMSSIVRQALAGLGVATLPTAFIRAALEDGSLLAVLPDWHSGITPINIVYLRHSLMPARLRSFIDFLIAHFPRADLESSA